MAPAWGKAWGVSWGNSWGSLGQEPEPETPEEPAYAGGGTTGKQRRLIQQIEQEDEAIFAFVVAFFAVVD